MEALLIRPEHKKARVCERPLTDLPTAPGILAVMALSRTLETHLSGLAQTLLVNDFPGSTLTRAERELIAAVVSAENGCVFCNASHEAFALELAKDEVLTTFEPGFSENIDVVMDALPWKLQELIQIAKRVANRSYGGIDVEPARKSSASDGDIQLTVLIAGAFAMFNRMVDGLRTMTPEGRGLYQEQAERIVEYGYERQPEMAAA